AKELSKLPLDQQFEMLAEALFGVDNQADKTRLAMKLFDSEGVALLQTMTNGAAGVRALREEARRLGLSLTQDQAEAAAKANDELTRMKSTVGALARDLTVSLAPALADAAEMLRTLMFGATPEGDMGAD